MAELSPRDRQFLREYVKDFNGSKAGRRVGMPNASAGVQAHAILKKAKAQEFLDTLIEARAARTQVAADRVVLDIAKLAFSSMDKYVRLDKDGNPRIDLTAATEDEWSAIQELTTETKTILGGEDNPDVEVTKVKIKLYDRGRALRDLGDHLGLFKTILADPDGRPLGSGFVDRLELARRSAYLLANSLPALEPAENAV